MATGTQTIEALVNTGLTRKTTRKPRPSRSKKATQVASVQPAPAPVASLPAPTPVPVEVKVEASAVLFPNDMRINCVETYAKEHYDEGGWDIVVETFTRHDIYQVVKYSQSEKGAIKKMAAYLEDIADHRQDIQSA
jgi:hypothetical protein